MKQQKILKQRHQKELWDSEWAGLGQGSRLLCMIRIITSWDFSQNGVN